MQRQFTGERIVFSTNGAGAIGFHMPKKKNKPTTSIHSSYHVQKLILHLPLT